VKKFLALFLMLVLLSISVMGYCEEPVEKTEAVEVSRLEVLQNFQSQLLAERVRLQDTLNKINEQLIQNSGRMLERKLADQEVEVQTTK